MPYHIRPIEPRDDARVDALIRSNLVEFGCNLPGTAWEDPDLGRFSCMYDRPNRRYWVAEDDKGFVVAGVGIGEIAEAPGVCELQKMYSEPAVRGSGVASLLMDRALAFAAEHYDRCYIETLSPMTRAHRFYEKYGFVRLEKPLLETEHYTCDIWYIRDL